MAEKIKTFNAESLNISKKIITKKKFKRQDFFKIDLSQKPYPCFPFKHLEWSLMRQSVDLPYISFRVDFEQPSEPSTLSP